MKNWNTVHEAKPMSKMFQRKKQQHNFEFFKNTSNNLFC